MKNTLYIKIGIRIKSARMHAKLRQYELAEMVNVTTQDVYKRQLLHKPFQLL